MPNAERSYAGAGLPVSIAEARALFASFADASVLLIAVSGGPDSTALLALAARWRAARKRGPKLIAVTIDHQLRPESAREARAVKRQAGQFGIAHRILRWNGKKPATGLQAAARDARYRLLAGAARHAGARHVLTAHTLDDQAETVLIRMARGSGLSGLRAMAPETVRDGVVLARPLLAVSKVRLIATLEAMGVSFSDDPSNRDPRFTRARLRTLMPDLAREGLTARRLALLAARARRADIALEQAVDAVAEGLVRSVGASTAHCAATQDRLVFDSVAFTGLPDEIGLRLLGRAVAATGEEGTLELGKLEALFAALRTALAERTPFRRTLAGALVALKGGSLTVERAPPRRARPGASKALTKRRHGRASLREIKV